MFIIFNGENPFIMINNKKKYIKISIVSSISIHDNEAQDNVQQ